MWRKLMAIDNCQPFLSFWSPPPTEKIVSMVIFQGKVLIATDRCIYQCFDDKVQLLEFENQESETEKP